MPASKIVMGLASYGRTFALTGSGDAPGLVSFDGELSGQAALPWGYCQSCVSLAMSISKWVQAADFWPADICSTEAKPIT